MPEPVSPQATRSDRRFPASPVFGLLAAALLTLPSPRAGAQVPSADPSGDAGGSAPLLAAEPQLFGLATRRHYAVVGEKDYLLPAETAARPIVSRKSGTCFECSEEVVTYRGFNGEDMTMIRYSGKYVALLVPETWPAEKIPTEELRILLDRSDVLYVHFRDLVGGEPGGEGLLPIAFVPETCGFGCGYVSAKGIEILNDEGAIRANRAALSEGILHNVVVHEMAHNFDIYGYLQAYLNDHAHAWTDFVNFYIYTYSRAPELDLGGPDDVLDFRLKDTFMPYVQDPGATWARCVRDENCPEHSANAVWGGFGNYLGQLQGPQALKDAMAFLSAYEDTVPEGAPTREDLHVGAFAAGTGLNLGCYVDFLRWHASSPLRAAMSDLYGGEAAFCSDGDGDGLSTIAGDCDDTDPDVSPLVSEIRNGVDDDCNGVVDDVLTAEAAGGDFQGEPKLELPASVEGRIKANDSDFFRFDLDSPGKVRFELCSAPDFQGWLFLYNPDGSWLDYQYVVAGTCSVKTYDLNAGRTWRFEVALNTASTPGRYSVAVRKPAIDGGDPTVEVAPSCRTGSVYTLTAATSRAAAAFETPSDVGFWVSGFGLVGTVPYEPQATLEWTPPAPLDKGTYSYRAQLFANGNPVSDVSPPRTFSPAGSAADSDGDGTPDGCDVCPGFDDGEDSDADGVPDGCECAATLCLNDSRFEVEVDWRNSKGETGTGKAVPFGTDNSGLLWFFNANNWEMMVKVLNGCRGTGHYWVFAAATTTVEYTLRVTDSETGAVVEYFNPLGNAAAAITDTGAFACDKSGAGAVTPRRRISLDDTPPEVLVEKSSRPFVEKAGCTASASGLCLNENRFQVEVDWRDASGNTGRGQTVDVSSSDSGLFWFFNANNWEMMVKVLNGCRQNRHFWVFSAATTNVEYTLRVTDTETGAVAEYFNPLGNAAAAIADTGAFATCPP